MIVGQIETKTTEKYTEITLNLIFFKCLRFLSLVDQKHSDILKHTLRGFLDGAVFTIT